MRKRSAFYRAVLTGLALAALSPAPAWACAACYGQADGPMAKGMNWGIFSLLAVIVSVLGGVAAFFVYLARKSSAVAATAPAGRLVGATHSSSM